jgi:hypothetical protein
MQHQPKVIFNSNADSFAKSPQLEHPFSFDSANGRRRGAQKEGRANLNALKHVSHNPFLECFEINRDIRKLWHYFRLVAFRRR